MRTSNTHLASCGHVCCRDEDEEPGDEEWGGRERQMSFYTRRCVSGRDCQVVQVNRPINQGLFQDGAQVHLNDPVGEAKLNKQQAVIRPVLLQPKPEERQNPRFHVFTWRKLSEQNSAGRLVTRTAFNV